MRFDEPRPWKCAIALWMLCVVQPLYDLLSQNVTFFIVRESSFIAVLLLALTLIAMPCVLVGFVHWLGKCLPRRLCDMLWMLLMALPCGALTMIVLLRWHDSITPLVSVTASVVVAVLCTLMYKVVPVVRRLLSVSWLSVFVLPLLFLFASPIKSLVPGYVDATQQATTSRAHAGAASAGPVVFLLWDELPLATLLSSENEINASLFPHFAALSRNATWYADATTVAGFTQLAIPSIVTGQFPEDGVSVNVASANRQAVFSVLQGKRQVHAYELYSKMCHVSICGSERADEARVHADVLAMLSDVSVLAQTMLLPKVWRGHLPNISGVWANFQLMSKDDPRDRIVHVIDDLRQLQHDDFVYAHFGVPHRPFALLPTGQMYAGFDSSSRGASRVVDGIASDKHSPMLSASAAAEAYQRHMLQVGYVDRALGRMMDALRDSGLWDDATIIVTSDHGMYFGADAGGRSLRAPTQHSVDAVLHVPLFIKYPQQVAGSVVRGSASVVDIVPTILDVVGVQAPQPLDGRSLRGRSGAEEPIIAFAKSPLERMVMKPRSGWFAALQNHLHEGLQAPVTSWQQVWDARSMPGVHNTFLHEYRMVRESTRHIDLVTLKNAMQGQQREVRTFTPKTSTIDQSRVKGWIRGGAVAHDSVFALAINHRIVCAVPCVTDSDGAQYVSCMLPPQTFSTPVERIDMFQVLQEDAGITLVHYPTRLGLISQ